MSNIKNSLPFTKIDHIEIIPKDFEKTLNFYTEILGFTLKRRLEVKILRNWKNGYTVEELAYITLGETMIEILKVTKPSDTQFDPWGIGYRMIALNVNDMDKAISYLKSKNIDIVEGPVTLGTSKRAEIHDPSGLPIELRQW